MKFKLKHLLKVRDVYGLGPCKEGVALFARVFPRGIELDQLGLNRTIVAAARDSRNDVGSYINWLIDCMPGIEWSTYLGGYEWWREEESIVNLFLSLEKFVHNNK